MFHMISAKIWFVFHRSQSVTVCWWCSLLSELFFKSWRAVCERICSDASVSLTALRSLERCTPNWTRFRCCVNSWKKPWWGPARRRLCWTGPHWSRPTMEVGHGRRAKSEWTARSSLKHSYASRAWRLITSQNSCVCMCVCVCTVCLIH